MKEIFEKPLLRKLRSMLKVDYKRMFTMPLIYIMIGVCFALPILILVMTTFSGQTEDGEATMSFTNVWQSIGSVSGESVGMDLTSMCNINLIYFLVAILVCMFVADEFRSGYAKNLFTVRSKKIDYVISKTLVTFTGAIIMFIAYFIGVMIGGRIAGLPFDMVDFKVSELFSCLLSKIFIMAIFISIGLLLSVYAKQKLWLSILGSLAVGMLLFTMIPMMAPLNANFLNLLMCLLGSVLFSVGLGAASNLVLNKTNLV